MPPKKAATAKKTATTASHPPYQGESISAVARFVETIGASLNFHRMEHWLTIIHHRHDQGGCRRCKFTLLTRLVPIDRNRDERANCLRRIRRHLTHIFPDFQTLADVLKEKGGSRLVISPHLVVARRFPTATPSIASRCIWLMRFGSQQPSSTQEIRASQQ